MPLYTTEALILRTYKLGESDRRVRRRGAGCGRPGGIARAVFRVLAAAAAGRLRAGRAAVRRGEIVPRGGAAIQSLRAGGRAGLARGPARAGSETSRVDFH